MTDGPAPSLTARFTTTLVAGGGNNVGIAVPDDVVLGFGRGRRVPVVVAIGEHTYRSSVVSMGGRFLISFSAAQRAATGLGAGDDVEVALTVDDEPRTVEVPEALAEALAAGDPTVRAAWDALSYSKQKAHALAVEVAKTDATRERRVTAVLAALG